MKILRNQIEKKIEVIRYESEKNVKKRRKKSNCVEINKDK